VIPNTKLRIRDGWHGALVAGVLLELYSIAFPFYVTHYLSTGGIAASAGFALVVLVLFYYFGLILLLGAEINAFLIDRRQGVGEAARQAQGQRLPVDPGLSALT